MRTIPLAFTTVFAKDDAGPYLANTAYFVPATGWMNSADIVEMRAAMEIAVNQSATMNVQVGYQVAQNADTPGTAYVADNTMDWQTAVDVYYATAFFDVAAVTGANALVRFGFLTKDTADTLGVARVSGRVDIKTCS
jgi:hypothetical protein